MRKFDLAAAFDALDQLKPSTVSRLHEEDEVVVTEEDRKLIDEVINDPAMQVFDKLCNGTFCFNKDVPYVEVRHEDDGSTGIFVGCEATMSLGASWTGDADGGYDLGEHPERDPSFELDDYFSPDDALQEEIDKNITLPISLSNGKKVISVGLASGGFDEDDYVATDYTIGNYSHEDAGIGHYEYWGASSYDSRPYTAFSGKVTYDFTECIYIEIE